MSDKQFVSFVEIVPDQPRLTKMWRVDSADGAATLGWVSWYPPWRRFAFGPIESTVYDAACLRQIAFFVEKATADRKAERQEAV